MTSELATRDNVVELARPVGGGLALSFQEMVQRVALVDRFYREVMQPDTDYGVIPGTGKPSLFQPGAQMLDQIFGYVPTFEIMPASVIDWARPVPFFHYVIRCRLVSRATGEAVAEGIGSCNSFEDKYRWRNAKPECTNCGTELRLSKNKPEWYCWTKVGGCGATFAKDEIKAGGKVENEDTASLENTISKMAQKRAHVAATLNATGASRIFTQDIEDLPQFQAALQVESVQSPVRVPDGHRPNEPRPDPFPGEEFAGGWNAELAERWNKGLDMARDLGLPGPWPLAVTASLTEINAALRQLGAAVKARQIACEAFEALAKQCIDIGIDVEVIDPRTLNQEALAETHAALAEMYQAALAESGATEEEAF